MLLKHRVNISTFAKTRQSDFCAVLIIFLLPLVLSLPTLLGWWSTNPIHFVSGIPSSFGKQILRGWPFIDPSGGFVPQALGKLAAQEWLSGRIPWWNYYSGVGRPLAAEMSPEAFFLPFTLLNLFSDGLLYIQIILQILAGLGTYCLLRKVGLIQLAAFTGAILFQFSGTFVWLGIPWTGPVAFLPWLLLGIEYARENSLRNSSGGWRIISVSVAFSIYGGFPEIAYIDGLLAAVWSCYRLFELPAETRFRFIKKLVTGVIVGLLLSTPLIIPFLEYLNHAYLWNHTFSSVIGGLSSEALPQLFFPLIYGIPWSHLDSANVMSNVWSSVGGYFTVAQFTAIVFALLMGRRSALVIVLLVWILICLARTFYLPFISALVDFVPLLKLVAVYRYAPPSWEFCGAVLCAKAINDLGSAYVHSPRKLIIGLLAALSISIICLYPAHRLVEQLYVQAGYRLFLWASVAWGFGSMIAIAVCYRLAKDQPMIAARAAAAILAVDAVALFFVPSLAGVIGGQTHTAGVDYLRQHIGSNRFYALGPILPNYSAFYGISSINHNALPIATNWAKYITDRLDPYANPVFFTGVDGNRDPKAPSAAEVLQRNLQQFEEIGVRYVVSPHSLKLFESASQRQENEESPRRVFESGDMDIYELPGAKPYFQVVEGECDLQMENRAVVSVSCSSPASLVRRELYYPGWQARAAGKTLNMEPYDDIFQAVRIAPGQYKITFTYVPTYIRLITGLFLIGIFWLTFGARRIPNLPVVRRAKSNRVLKT
jgi:hypothetical protein